MLTTNSENRSDLEALMTGKSGRYRIDLSDGRFKVFFGEHAQRDAMRWAREQTGRYGVPLLEGVEIEDVQEITEG